MVEPLYNFNDCQTPLEDLNLSQYPDEVKEQFFDCINTIPYIKRLIAKDRPRAKDLLRDKDGKIFVDVSQPHIIEDVDYFRPSAIKFQQTGKYTELRPNPNPNSEYGKWIIEEIRRCREGYVRESDGEWVTGDMYFFLNYCQIQLIKKDPNGKTIRTVDFPAFWDGHYYKSHYLNQCREEGKHAAELASRGKGKALPLTTIVPTPSGYKFWGDIEVGDKLWGPDGTETTVTGIPYKGLIQLLKIELADGRSIYCSREHEFSITYRGIPKVAEAEWIGYNYHKTRKKGTKNPTGDEYVITLPINNKVEYPHQKVLIDPYTLGLILGDGCLRTPSLQNVIRFTGLIEDVEFYSTQIPYNITDHNSRNIEHSIHKDNIMDDIKNMGLYMTTSHTKFIPEEYKYNTSEVRVAVLQGLVDTDGWINGSTFCYCTSSERLKDDVLEIARSLGIKAYSFKKKNAWTISMQSADYTLCRLPRKIQKIKPITERYRKSCKRVTVTRVSYVNECIGKCVSVDRQDGLYLANDYIVTHNSFYGAAMLAKRFILGESAQVNKKVQCVVTASERKYIQGANQILDMFQYYIDFNARNTQFPRRRLTSSLQNLQWTMGYQDINTGTRLGTQNSVMGITSKDDESKLRGSRGVLYLLEEAGSFPRLLNLYQVLRPSVEDGDAVWGTIFLYGCCCAGTKVYKPNGESFNIEDVVLQDKLLGYNGNNSTVENISWKQPIGYKDCARITTEKNNYLECSTDHPILAVNKDAHGHSLGSCSFYRVNELKVGDTLLMPKTIGKFGNIHEEHAFLLGALFGDGSYANNSCVSLSITTEEEYEYYNNHYDIGISKFSKGDNLYAQIYFRSLLPLLKKYRMHGQSFERKKLPYNIFDWDKESTCAFLGGYFTADGNVQIVKGKHRSIKLTCKYEIPLQQVKDLLLKLGISSHIYKERKLQRALHSNVNNKDYLMPETHCYVLYISNSGDIVTFRDNIKLLIKAKQERLDSYIPSTPKGIANNLVFQLRDNGKGKLLEGKIFNNMQMVTIKSIENIGIQRIYNMTADTTHTYISNGFVSSNTSGDSDSDFSSMQELMYNPKGYNIKSIENVYDKEGQGRKEFTYFFPGYINRANCYDENGNSDVTKALLEILNDRYTVKYNSTDINAITKRIAEIPITPQEAILKTKGNIFPVTQLTERLNQIDNNPSEYDDVYCGDLVLDKGGQVKYVPTNQRPIRDFPLKDNTAEGCLEIYQMPESDATGKINPMRYIMGFDPYDNDQANSMSLGSMFVLDLFTDRIVAEFTGRTQYAEQLYEKARLLAIFYNCKILYESNIKGTFAYFSKMNSTHLLADTPEYLRDKQLIKYSGFGSSAKGVTATLGVNNYANDLIKEWMIKPVPTIVKEDNEDKEITVPNLYFIRNRALLKEAILYNPIINVDRIRALGMVMLYREERMIMFQGDTKNAESDYNDPNYAGNDDFFTVNYDYRFN